MGRIEVEVALDARAVLGEGPVWDARDGRLIWVDILRHTIHHYDPTSQDDAMLDVGRPVGAVGLREAGGLVLAVEDGFAILNRNGVDFELVAPVGADDPGSRFNDGKCDARGRFWAGTMAYDLSPGAASLYRLDVDHRVEEVLPGVTISNGMAWSSDGRTMYYTDSFTQGGGRVRPRP